MEREENGVIVKTSSNYSVVNVSIDGAPKSFIFSKALFHAFGIKCAGSMKNIIEIGTEVSVRYKPSLDESEHVIVAVWLGERPNYLQGDVTALKAIYDQTGSVSRVLDEDNLLVRISESDQDVFLNKRAAFRNGISVEHAGDIEIGGTVNFDAVPFIGSEQNGYCNATYKATCAWIGPRQPRLVDRFDLSQGSPKFEEGGALVGWVCGHVSVIPNDLVALVDVQSECQFGKIVLFRSSLRKKCHRLQDVISVGDQLYMRLCMGHVFPEQSLCFVVEAWKDGCEISTNGESDDSVSLEDEANDFADADEMRDGIGISVGSDTRGVKREEILFSDPSLTGSLLPLTSDSAYILFEGWKIFVEPSKVYVDKSLCTKEMFKKLVSSREFVHFEAIPSSCRDYNITHDATRVWVGNRPSLADVAESLPPPKWSLLEDENSTFTGYILMYCLPKIALIYVELEDTMACLHVSAFIGQNKNRCEYAFGVHCITNHVKLGQYVRFKVKRVAAFPTILCAFDVDVLDGKMSQDVESLSIVSNSSELSVAPEAPVDLSPSTTTSSSTSVSSEMYADANDISDSEQSVVSVQESNVPSESAEGATGSTYAVMPFRKSIAFKDKTFVLGHVGTLTGLESGKGKIKVAGFDNRSFIVQNLVLYGLNNVPVDPEIGTKCKVRFDAELVVSSEGYDFHAYKVWVDKGTRPPADCCVASDLNNGPVTFAPSKLYAGTIKCIPSHDSAIALVQDASVLVNFDSLVTSNSVNPDFSHIEMFLTVGEKVMVEVEMRRCSSDNREYFRAVKCYYAARKLGRKTKNSGLHIVFAPNHGSWFNIWGLGEPFQAGRVKRKKKHYLVSLTHSKQPGQSLSLNLCTRGQLFVDGLLTDPKEVPDLESSTISCRIVHSGQKAVNRLKKSVQVVCYIGDEPSPFTLLTDILSVTKGLINRDQFYEGIVESFPLLTHAICRVGFAPVLVDLSTCKDGMTFEENGLKIGDFVLMRVQENTSGKQTYLSSSETWLAKTLGCTNALINLPGTVASVPTPTGTIRIQNSSLLVSFEWCNVHVSETEFLKRKTVWPWYNRMKKAVKVGAQVRFTAVNTFLKKHCSYRAIEVWVADV